MWNWIMKLVSADYKWSVAIKKVSYFVGKGIVGVITYGQVGQAIGSHLSPEQLTQIQTAAGLAAGGALEALHDYLRMKYPEVKWI